MEMVFGKRTAFMPQKFTPFLFHYVIFIISFLFGVLAVKYKFVFSDISAFSKLLADTVNSTYLENFISYFAVNTIIAVLFCLCGYFTFGSVLSTSLFIAYSIGNGALYALICRQCGAVGIAVNLTLFLVPTVLIFLLFTVISTSSAYFSNGLAVAVFTNRSLIGIKSRMNDMLLLLVVSLPCIALISALRALFILIFSGAFFA